MWKASSHVGRAGHGHADARCLAHEAPHLLAFLQVDSGVALERLCHREPSEGRRKTAARAGRRMLHQAVEERLGVIDGFPVACVHRVPFEEAELGVVMGAVHVAVPEAPAHLVDVARSESKQALHPQLGRGDEPQRPGLASSIQQLRAEDLNSGLGDEKGRQRRGIDLHVAAAVEKRAHGCLEPCLSDEPLSERGFHSGGSIAEKAPRFRVCGGARPARMSPGVTAIDTAGHDPYIDWAMETRESIHGFDVVLTARTARIPGGWPASAPPGDRMRGSPSCHRGHRESFCILLHDATA